MHIKPKEHAHARKPQGRQDEMNIGEQQVQCIYKGGGRRLKNANLKLASVKHWFCTEVQFLYKVAIVTADRNSSQKSHTLDQLQCLK
jgi:hypothetical protein